MLDLAIVYRVRFFFLLFLCVRSYMAHMLAEPSSYKFINKMPIQDCGAILSQRPTSQKEVCHVRVINALRLDRICSYSQIIQCEYTFFANYLINMEIYFEFLVALFPHVILQIGIPRSNKPTKC